MMSPHAPDGLHPQESVLDAAVHAILTESIPTASIQRVQQGAMLLDRTPTAPARRASEDRRHLSRAAIGSAIVAAAMAAIGASLFFDRSTSNAFAFAQVVEKVKAANSVSFTITSRFGLDPEVHSRNYIRGYRIRTELEDVLVSIADLSTKQVLWLDPQRKLAELTDVNAGIVDGLANPVDQLRQAKSDTAEAIGEELIDGVRCAVFRMKNARWLAVVGDMLVWVDPNSGLPVRIVISDSTAKDKAEIRLDRFTWNVPLEPALLSLNVPEGFQMGEVAPVLPKAAQPPTDSQRKGASSQN
jgi:outer membrane lipoprotein-sorting protein